MAPDPARIEVAVPVRVREILSTLWSNGHAAYIVGGSLRDALLGRPASDWDVATDARPERIQALLPGSHYKNRFGTVLVPGEEGMVDVTTFRLDHRYGDHRRPDQVTFGVDLREDLARRDFTVNALAWGREGDEPRTTPGGDRPPARVAGEGRLEPRAGDEAAGPPEPHLVDEFGGIEDCSARVLRSVGDPLRRFDEDALRLVRAARLSAQLDFTIEPCTLAAMRDTAPLVRHVSQERIGQELRRMLRSAEPSRALRTLSATGILAAALPELAEQIGVPQAKVPGMDCWEHSLATVDAARRLAPGDEQLALAALLHDAGKPRTMAGGHFFGHEEVGAGIAHHVLRGMAVPREDVDVVTHLVRHHMFNYEPAWSDAAVRRFVQRVGREAVERLLLLREADNAGSGQRPDQGHLSELRRRVAELEARGFPVSTHDLAVDGNDLQRELGLAPGPVIGALLERLLDSAVADPSRNTYRQSILDALGWLPELLANKDADEGLVRDEPLPSAAAARPGAPGGGPGAAG